MKGFPWKRWAAVGVWVVLLTSCATPPTPSLVQPRTPMKTGFQLLVMGEDADPTSIRRGSDIFRRLLGEVKAAMSRQGFRVVDEEMLAVAGGWRLRDRMSKTELIEVSRMANAAGDSRFNHRVMVLFSIHAYQRSAGFATEVQTRVDGEIYDAKTYQFIGQFSLPTDTYPAPAECNELCIAETVGNRASEIAMRLGDTLGKKLAFLGER